jgi:hypothetical protein
MSGIQDVFGAGHLDEGFFFTIFTPFIITKHKPN